MKCSTDRQEDNAIFASTATRKNSKNSADVDRSGWNDDTPRTSDHSEVCSLAFEEWMDSKEAAAYLRVSVGTLRNLTSNGHIPYYKLGKRNRYLKSEMRRILLQDRRGGFNGN